MSPIVDRSVLQHLIEEARKAGVEEFIFVTGRNKNVIEAYFDTSYELEDTTESQAASVLRRGVRRPAPATVCHGRILCVFNM